MKLYLFVLTYVSSTILALFCNFAFPICQRTLVSQKFKFKNQNSEFKN
ncbi:hypothetical protein HNQ91_006104 [Filimonas zeae]|nr:hypothetical protein [Filimonas zeae]